MDLSQPVDWVGKSAVGYVMNAEFSRENVKILVELINKIKTQFGDAVFGMPEAALHITLLDWIAPLVDYEGRDKGEIFSEIQPSYDKTMSEILSQVDSINVHFDTIEVSPSTVYIIGKDNGEFQSIREQFINKVELLPNTKLPPQIVHSSLIRFTKPIDTTLAKAVVSRMRLDITQRITYFRLIRSKREPNLEFETIKRYELKLS